MNGLEFQSRNRESSNFNGTPASLAVPSPACFNLVIENLLISTVGFAQKVCVPLMFQSRNRESSNFNLSLPAQHGQ